MLTATERANRDRYDQLGKKYIVPDDEGYLGKYHRRRISSAKSMINSVVTEGRLFDFGCGSGELFSELSGFSFDGCDISPAMIDLCRERVSVDCKVGGVETFESETGPFDAVVALNVLPFLSQEDETRLLTHAAKVLRPGGGLLISHTNVLFDLVSYNRYTVEFFRDVIAPAIGAGDREIGEISDLLTDPHHPPEKNVVGPAGQKSDRDIMPKRRVDPFTYGAEVEQYGFNFKQIQPLNCYAIPPRITHKYPELESGQPDWVDRLPPTLAKILSTQFQMVFVRR